MISQKKTGLCSSSRDTIVHSTTRHLHDEHRGQETLEANPSVALAWHSKIASLVCKLDKLDQILETWGQSRQNPAFKLCAQLLQHLCSRCNAYIISTAGQQTPVLSPSTVLCSGLPTASVRLEAAPHDSWLAVLKRLAMVFSVQKDSPRKVEKKETCPKTLKPAETALLVFECLPKDQKIGLGRAARGNLSH